MEDQPQTNFLLRHWKLLLALTLLLIVGWVLYSYSVITVEVSQISGSGDIKYQILNQGNNKTTEVTSKSAKLTKIVSRSNYELSVSQNDKSSFSVIKTKGFFRKTVVEARLLPSPGGQFVGNGPEPCMYYTSNQLFSYSCEGAQEITAHMPATAKLPSYNLKNSLPGQIEGVVKTKEGILALTQNPTGGDGDAEPHILYSISGGSKLVSPIDLTSLSRSNNYRLKAFGSGFIAYDESLNDVRYFASKSASPQTINIEKPSDPKQKPLSLASSSNSIVVAYSDKADFEDNTSSKGIGKVKSEFYLYENGKTRKLSFNKQFINIEFCASSTLCMIEAGTQQLYVYDISSKPKLMYSVQNVSRIQQVGRRLLVAKDSKLISLDPVSAKGSVAYEFNEYKFCGLDSDSDKYLLCISSSGGDNMVLRIDPSTTANDHIDTKLAAIQKLSEVKSASVYGNLIFISPDLGSLVYNSAIESYDYNPLANSNAQTAINKEINRLGIDRRAYTITIN